jgi:ATP-binding cassette subfamily F protein uup
MRELEQLPGRIDDLETRIAGMTLAMNDPGFFRQASDEIVAANASMATLQAELEAAYVRWQELEAICAESR